MQGIPAVQGLLARIPPSARTAIAAFPAALLICVPSFAAGGYLPGASELLIVAFAAGLIAWLLIAQAPAATFGRPLVVAALALGCYCVWTLASALWSDAPARAAVDFDRALLYLLALLAGGVVAGSPERTRWIVRWIVAGGAIVCLAAFVSRTLSDLFPTSADFADERLNFPLTYWNSLGLLAGITLILATTLACSENEPRPIRVLAVSATPMIAATLVLTFGRGAVATAIVGLLIVVIAGFGRGSLRAIVVIGAASAAAVYAALRADLLATEQVAAPAAIEQGHKLALAIAIIGALAAVVMVVAPSPRWRPRAGFRLSWGWGVALAAVTALVLVIAGAPRFVEDGVEQFTTQQGVGGEVTRDRFVEFGSNGRVDLWQVALDEFAHRPLAGRGAGTYETAWERERPYPLHVKDAHSLYFETLGELGVIGLALLVIVLASIMLAFWRRGRTSERLLYVGLGAAALAWLIQAGFDWSWEMPAVTAWLFFAGGAALARPVEDVGVDPRPAPSIGPRIVLAVGLALLCVLPIRIAVSQFRLDDSRDAFEGGDCTTAVDSALSSRSAFGSRSEPYAILAYCDLREGEPKLAARMITRAVELDRENWQYHYVLALAQASTGADPLPEARRALELNPLEEATTEAVTAFSAAGDDQSARRRAAEQLPLPQS